MQTVFISFFCLNVPFNFHPVNAGSSPDFVQKGKKNIYILWCLWYLLSLNDLSHFHIYDFNLAV